MQQDNLEFKHLCDDWREGCDGQEAFDFSLSSECEEDKIGLFQPKLITFTFRRCSWSFLCLCFVVLTSVLDKDSIELKVLAQM